MAVIDATFAVAKREPEKTNSGMNGIQTLDFCDTGAEKNCYIVHIRLV